MDNKNNALIRDLETLMSDRFGRYSKYIIQERALPDVRDGLKPVQRRILYAMYSDGNTAEKGYRKSAKTVGLVIGNFHPHGDSSVYEAMVRLSQSWKMNIPMVDMQGNNGSIDDDPAAAMRYTEARLSKFAQGLLEDIEEETVIFTPNFDDTSLEPSVLPARLPQLLINGVSGIAAGYATNIPPHSITEILEGTIYRLNHPSSTLEELETLILGPDFPTGGIVQGKKGIHDAFLTGKGRVVIRAKTDIVQTKTIQQIVITEIPYEVIKSNLVKKLDDIRLNKQLEALLDVRDESDRNGLRIVLDIRKDADAHLILNYLFKNTDCQIYYNYNMVAIIHQRPVLCGLIEILDAFIQFRKEVVLKRSRFQHDAISKRIHILEGLIKAISVLDEVITLIRSSKDKQSAKENLMERFMFSEVQAEAIVSLRLYRLTNTDIFEIKQELAELQHDLQLLVGILQSPELLKNVLIKELQAILAAFKIARRSKIEDEVQEIVIDKMSMIPNDKTILTLSKDGYIKRVSLRSYQSSENTVPTVKEGDELIGVIEAETYDQILLFTDNGSYAALPLYSIEEAKWKDLGNHFSHYAKSEGHEKVIAALMVKNYKTDAFVVSVTQKGQIKRTPISEYEVSRTSKVYDAISLSKEDKVISTFVLYRNEPVLIVSQEGYGVVYDFDDLPESLTKSKGVKAMNLSQLDSIAGAIALRDEKAAVVVMTINGQMKRLKISDFALNRRPAKGELLARKVKSNPMLIKHIKLGYAYDSLKITADAKLWYAVKDIPFMDKSASYNAGISALSSWYLVKDIEEVRITDTMPPKQIDMIKKPNVQVVPQSKEEPVYITGSQDLPKEVLAEGEEAPSDVEFIHFDL